MSYDTITKFQGMTMDELAERIGLPVSAWARQCHSVSVAFVQSDVLPGCRVVRGWRKDIPGQHSWVITSVSPKAVYDPESTAIDLSAWSYRKGSPCMDTGTQKAMKMTPHGLGSIWDYGRPERGDGESLTLPIEPKSDLDRFMKVCFPAGYDRTGLMGLANAPVENWPAAEFHQAMVDAGFEYLLRIDVLSHLLDTVNGHGTRSFTHKSTVETGRP